MTRRSHHANSYYTEWAVGSDAISSIRVAVIPTDLRCEETETCIAGDASQDGVFCSGAAARTSGAFRETSTACVPAPRPSSGYDVYPYSTSECPASGRVAVDPVSAVFWYNGTGLSR